MSTSQPDNLLMKLLHWAHKQDENFTTEAFVHLIKTLIALEPQTAKDLLSNLTKDFLHLYKKDFSFIEINTQVHTDDGRPDIEIRTKERLVYIEVKVDSKLGRDQLDRYRAALEKSDFSQTLLVLLTRYGSLKGADKADFFIQWHHVADWLQNAVSNIKNHQAAFLVQQFIEYLQLHKMTFETVEGEIAKSVQSLEQLMGQGDQLPKIIHRLETLTRFEELTPLHDGLMMLETVVKNRFGTVRLVSGKHRGGWIGYSLDNMNYFLAFYYKDPRYLIFDTYKVKVDKDKYDQVKKGELFKDGNRLRWQIRLDLSSSDLNFYKLSKDQQLKTLKDFVDSSYQASEQIQSDTVKKGEIAKSVQFLERLMGQGDQLPKVIRKLDTLTEFEKLTPLHDVLMMLETVVKSRFDTVRLVSGRHRGGWIGYSLDNMNYFLAFYYKDPRYLIFDTYKVKVDKDKYNQVKKGELFKDGNRLRWQNRLDLGSSKLNFYRLSKDRQMDTLKDFVDTSWQVSEQIKK